MKKLLLTFMAGVAAVYAFGQSIRILDVSSNIMNGQTVDIWLDTSDPAPYQDFPVKNISSTAKYIKVKRYEISTVSGSSNLLCWLACYAPPVSVSPAVLVNSNSTHNFSSHYYHNNNLGTTTLVYTFWDSLNVNDSAQFTVKWHITPTGINEPNPVSASISGIFPNPAGSSATINFQLNNADNAVIKIFNVLGSEVRRIAVTAKDGNAVLNVADLDPGIYFCSFIADNKILTTRKLTVAR